MSQRGRPITPRKRIPVGLRMTPQMHKTLIERCCTNGRSLTQEIELLLELALMIEGVLNAEPAAIKLLEREMSYRHYLDGGADGRGTP
jgi:hypothetical protein